MHCLDVSDGEVDLLTTNSTQLRHCKYFEPLSVEHPSNFIIESMRSSENGIESCLQLMLL
jgi:hypothetical protein